MWNTLFSAGLYFIGLVLGYGLIPFFVIRKPIDEEEGIKLDEKYDQLFLSFKFMDEMEEAPDSTLNEEELRLLRDKVLHYEIPFLHHNVILFYDQEKEAFCYYANSTIIYKYLNVAARRYVLDYGCKQVYKEMLPSTRKEEKTVTFGQFVPKVGKTTLEKDMNRFIYLGNLHEYKPKQEEPNKISFSDYMKLSKMTVPFLNPVLAPLKIPSSIQDNQWTKTD